MRFPIGLKIFGIAVGLLVLMATVALMSMRMTRTVDGQLAIIDQNYFPAYVALAQANIRSIEELAYVRRLMLAIGEHEDNRAKVDDLRQRVANNGKASDEEIANARQYINRQIADPLVTAETAPTKRDRHLQLIAERGRMGWQRASGYNWRALVEADIGRYKRVIGDALRSRTEGRQTTEVAIAVASLNRMLKLGRPEYLRLK